MTDDIEVVVKLVGNLRKYGDHRNKMEVEDGTTVEDIIDRLGIPEEENVMVLVNEKQKYTKYELRDGDVVDLLRPVSGEEGT